MHPSGPGEATVCRMKIGILEVQGAFHEHKVALSKAKECLQVTSELDVVEVRHLDHIVNDMDGLVIPGGESTTISLFLKRNNMEDSLRKWMQSDNHVILGTCAGMILLSKFTENQKEGGQPTLGMMDTVVSRNFFGRQVQSFEAPVTLKSPDLEIPECKRGNDPEFHGVFIRAPAVVETKSSDVQVLATLTKAEEKEPIIVAVRQRNIMATAFHPELTDDLRWHIYFLKMVLKAKSLSTQ